MFKKNAWLASARLSAAAVLAAGALVPVVTAAPALAADKIEFVCNHPAQWPNLYANGDFNPPQNPTRPADWIDVTEQFAKTYKMEFEAGKAFQDYRTAEAPAAVGQGTVYQRDSYLSAGGTSMGNTSKIMEGCTNTAPTVALGGFNSDLGQFAGALNSTWMFVGYTNDATYPAIFAQDSSVVVAPGSVNPAKIFLPHEVPPGPGTYYGLFVYKPTFFHLLSKKSNAVWVNYNIAPKDTSNDDWSVKGETHQIGYVDSYGATVEGPAGDRENGIAYQEGKEWGVNLEASFDFDPRMALAAYANPEYADDGFGGVHDFGNGSSDVEADTAPNPVTTRFFDDMANADQLAQQRPYNAAGNSMQETFVDLHIQIDERVTPKNGTVTFTYKGAAFRPALVMNAAGERIDVGYTPGTGYTNTVTVDVSKLKPSGQHGTADKNDIIIRAIMRKNADADLSTDQGITAAEVLNPMGFAADPDPLTPAFTISNEVANTLAEKVTDDSWRDSANNYCAPTYTLDDDRAAFNKDRCLGFYGYIQGQVWSRSIATFNAKLDAPATDSYLHMYTAGANDFNALFAGAGNEVIKAPNPVLIGSISSNYVNIFFVNGGVAAKKIVAGDGAAAFADANPDYSYQIKATCTVPNADGTELEEKEFPLILKDGEFGVINGLIPDESTCTFDEAEVTTPEGITWTKSFSQNGFTAKTNQLSLTAADAYVALAPRAATVDVTNTFTQGKLGAFLVTKTVDKSAIETMTDENAKAAALAAIPASFTVTPTCTMVGEDGTVQTLGEFGSVTIPDGGEALIKGVPVGANCLFVESTDEAEGLMLDAKISNAATGLVIYNEGMSDEEIIAKIKSENADKIVAVTNAYKPVPVVTTTTTTIETSVKTTPVTTVVTKTSPVTTVVTETTPVTTVVTETERVTTTLPCDCSSTTTEPTGEPTAEPPTVVPGGSSNVPWWVLPAAGVGLLAVVGMGAASQSSDAGTPAGSAPAGTVKTPDVAPAAPHKRTQLAVTGANTGLLALLAMSLIVAGAVVIRRKA